MEEVWDMPYPIGYQAEVHNLKAKLDVHGVGQGREAFPILVPVTFFNPHPHKNFYLFSQRSEHAFPIGNSWRSNFPREIFPVLYI